MKSHNYKSFWKRNYKELIQILLLVASFIGMIIFFNYCIKLMNRIEENYNNVYNKRKSPMVYTICTILPAIPIMSYGWIFIIKYIN